MSDTPPPSHPAKPVRRSRRRLIVVTLASGLFALSVVSMRPVAHVLSTAWSDKNAVEPVPPGFADDASRMNLTQVAEVIPVADELGKAEVQLAALLARARREGLRVSIAGARHSMGGHTISPGGIVIDMLPFHHMELTKSRTCCMSRPGRCGATSFRISTNGAGRQR